MSAVLAKILEPLAQHYSDPDVIEIRMRKPGTVIVDHREKGLEEIQDPTLTLHVLEQICQSLSNKNGLGFDPDKNPQVSTILPEKHRFECMMGPSVLTGVSLAIRCKHLVYIPWEAFGVEGDLLEYFREIVESQKNIIISGATNTGKTTFMNKVIGLIPDDVRIITAEDTPELETDRFWNGVGLMAAREDDSKHGLMNWGRIANHMMRTTPTSIIVGEISIQNAFAALNFLNTGNSGFMCSVHAESPEMVINRKFDQNISWAGRTVPKISEYLGDLVDSIIQIKRDENGRRTISDILEPKKGRSIMKDGVML